MLQGRRYGVYPTLAATYGVTPATIGIVARGERWGDVEPVTEAEFAMPRSAARIPRPEVARIKRLLWEHPTVNDADMARRHDATSEVIHDIRSGRWWTTVEMAPRDDDADDSCDAWLD